MALTTLRHRACPSLCLQQSTSSPGYAANRIPAPGQGPAGCPLGQLRRRAVGGPERGRTGTDAPAEIQRRHAAGRPPQLLDARPAQHAPHDAEQMYSSCVGGGQKVPSKASVSTLRRPMSGSAAKPLVRSLGVVLVGARRLVRHEPLDGASGDLGHVNLPGRQARPDAVARWPSLRRSPRCRRRCPMSPRSSRTLPDRLAPHVAGRSAGADSQE